MIKNSQVFNNKTLNIFCDASIRRYEYEDGTIETLGCPGAVAFIGYEMTRKNIIDSSYEILRNSTNNKSETKAIYLAVLLAIKYRNQYNTINIFSDSKICVFGLREWIFNWVRDSDPEGKILISSSGEAVKNQDCILQVVYTILQNNLKVNLYHINGHKNAYNYDHVLEAKKTFISSNYIQDNVDDTLIQNLCLGNDFVDKTTRERVNSFEPIRFINPMIYMNYIYKPFDFDRYRNLVTN